jgi:Family of unknown function (DUF6325)
MAYGPAELIVVKFPGNRFRGEIIPALADLVETGTIRLIDLLFVMKDEDGSITTLEAETITETEAQLGEIAGDSGLMSEDDVELVAEELEPGSSAGLLLFEHTWAAPFTQAMRDAGGELIYDERIPAAVVEEVENALAAV